MDEHARTTAALVDTLKEAENVLESEREKAARAHEELGARTSTSATLAKSSRTRAARRGGRADITARVRACISSIGGGRFNRARAQKQAT